MSYRCLVVAESKNIVRGHKQSMIQTFEPSLSMFLTGHSRPGPSCFEPGGSMTSTYAIRPSVWLLGAFLACVACQAQDLTPRAYVITPVHSNVIVVEDSFFSGNLMFGSTVPITDATANVNVPIFNIYHSLNFFGRSANFTAELPYGVGRFKGMVLNTETNVYRSGMFDSVFRFAVNLKGGPAMDVKEFQKYRQKTVLGASLRVVIPTGQYDPRRLINYGANRWAFKPEFGYSRKLGHWILDGYGGIWFFTRNPEFFSRNEFVPFVQGQTQRPIAAFEWHLSYDVKPRLWMSLDGNFWLGGRTSLNAVQNPATLQRDSRLGVTGSIPFTGHQSLKLSYSRGLFFRFGGDFRKLSVAWQYAWVGRP